MIGWIVLAVVIIGAGVGALIGLQGQEAYDIYEDFKAIKSAMRAFRKDNKGLSKGIENLKPYMPADARVRLDRYTLSIDDKFLVVKKLPKDVDPLALAQRVGGDSKYANNLLKLSFYAVNLGPEPEAVIDIMPLKNITTTTKLDYSSENSTAENNEILKVEWENDQAYFDTEGVHKVKLRVMDKHFRWSEWASKDIFISEIKGVKSIHGFGGHVMVVHNNGRVEGYGENGSGQLGNCTNQNNVKLEPLVQLEKVETLVTGNYHTLFLMSDKQVYATGKNDFGQLGIGDRTNAKVPKLTWGIDNVIAIAAGNSFSAAVTMEGNVYTWGQNENKCLGQSEAHYIDRPMRVEEVSNVKSIALGNDFALALNYDGTVVAWGDNNDGALALGFKSKNNEPAVSMLKSIDYLVAGKNHGYGINKQKKVVAFGSNKNSQLGFEGEKEVLFPVEVPGLKDIVKIVTHQNCSMALDERGNVYAWGQFSPLDQDYAIKPYLSEELKYVKDIALSSKYGYALMEDGTVYEFGSRFENLKKLERSKGVVEHEHED